ncbi:MAG: ATP-binding protein [Crocinitomicaceae bacterium]|nr:ATP-binding protein [Crocinitomicaceae bacterium]
MLASTHGVGISGSNARLVSVQIHRTKGARIHTSGISWTALKHSLARIYAAFESCGLPRPTGAITLHVGPEMHHTSTAHLDLPIAISLLCSMGKVPIERCNQSLFIGELALDGTISLASQTPPIGRLKSMASGPVNSRLLNQPLQDIRNVYTPHLSNPAWEDHAPVDCVNRKSTDLVELLASLNGHKRLPVFRATNNWNQRIRWNQSKASEFESIRLNEQHRLALVVAAAGKHHTLIIGSPGTGKSMMARCIHELIPTLKEEQASQLRNWSISRGEAMALTEVPPFRAPHSQTSAAGLLGTWSKQGFVAGECSLANGGVLALDEFPEFNRSCIESLRTPMERQLIQIGRMSGTVDLPFQSLVVATANPCPCGYFQDRQRKCACTVGGINRYLRRITGPISSRFQIHLETNIPDNSNHEKAPNRTSWLHSLALARSTVMAVREELKSSSSGNWRWKGESTAALQAHVRLHRCSERKIQSIKSVAHTHALITNMNPLNAAIKTEIDLADVAFACQLQIFDRTNWWESGQSSSWRTFPPDETNAYSQ